MEDKQIETLKSFIAQGIKLAWRDTDGKYHEVFMIKEHADEPVAFFRDGTYAALLAANAEDFCIFNVQHLFQS